MDFYTEVYQENDNEVKYLDRSDHMNSKQFCFVFLWFLYNLIRIFEVCIDFWNWNEFTKSKKIKPANDPNQACRPADHGPVRPGLAMDRA
jgi:hypothetical protein